MALNQMIAQGAQFNMPDPVAQYAKMQQLQTAQNQNAFAQYQLSSTQRGDMQQNALYKRLQDPNFSQENPEHLASLAQFGTPGIAAMKAITDAKNAALTGYKTQGDILKQKTDHVNQMKRDLSVNPSDAQIDAYVEDLNTSGLYKPNEIAAATKHLSGLKDIPLEQRKALLAGAGATAGDLARSNRPIAVSGSLMSPTGGLIATAPAGPIKPPEKLEVMKALGYSMDAAGDAAYEAAKRAPPAAPAVPADVATMQTLGIPATPEGYVYFQALKAKDEKPTDLVRNYEYAKKQGFKGDLFAYEKSLKEAGRAPAQPRPEQPPVAVVDPTTGKQVFVSREEALKNRMTPAAAMENLPPKEIQKREAALPQATSAVQGFESKSDKFVADLMELRNHPGLSSITGIAAGRMPGLTADGRAAQALYDKVVAKGGFQALQDLRDASKTGGALGNVSNQEGKQLTASFAAIDRRQDAQDVQAAIDQAIADIQGSKTRMREAYDSTYSYKSGGTSAPAAAPGRPAVSNIDALLNKYK